MNLRNLYLNRFSCVVVVVVLFESLLFGSALLIGTLPVPISPDDFPPVPKQFSVKVEMVLAEEKLVEEFMLYWDEELNLARFDYAIGRIMPPFNTSRAMKTIHDFGNGKFHSLRYGSLVITSNGVGRCFRWEQYSSALKQITAYNTVHTV